MIWSIQIPAGYFFGYAIEELIRAVKHYEIIVLFVIAGTGIALWAARRFMRRSAKRAVLSLLQLIQYQLRLWPSYLYSTL